MTDMRDQHWNTVARELAAKPPVGNRVLSRERTIHVLTKMFGISATEAQEWIRKREAEEK